jgi:CRP-like cAMP-binding protein
VIHANQLIARLGRHDRHLLLAIGENVLLLPGVVLFDRGEEAAFVYFPTAGAVVLSVPSAPTGGLGILLVGVEGMLGTHRVLGDCRSTMRAAAQTSSCAMRINASEFSQALATSHTLRGAMLEYVGGVVNQVAAAAACTRHNAIGQRLAGWLLMSRDREGADSFHLTQDALAITLGVRRVGITVAAQALQRLHLIDYRRGDVTVIDVAGLKAVAGYSYFACGGTSANARASARRARRARSSNAITAASQS